MNDLITILDVLIIGALIFTNLVLLCVSSYLFYYITTLRELNAQLQKEYDRIRVNYKNYIKDNNYVHRD